jgi:hypothetical protein
VSALFLLRNEAERTPITHNREDQQVQDVFGEVEELSVFVITAYGLNTRVSRL